MLHKFGSNLSFKSDGNSVNMVNSARRLSYTTGDFLLASRRARGRVRLHAGMGKVAAWLLLASWPPFKACAVAVLLISSSLLFPSSPLNSGEPCCRCSASIVSTKPVPASPNPCAPSQPALVACRRWETPLDAFLPRGRQHHRRKRVTVASALR